ncbi:MAG: hypothetical protein PHY47_07550 [Lachnospiraceae bacterium]|nr:hypothetical protein [Lachnospiraceae bacterium]
MRNHKFLFSITISYFLSGLINIHFSLLGIVCMTLPIILLLRDQKKTWCQGYCPRASLYTTCGKSKKWPGLKTPQFFIKGNMKWIMLTYFGISLTFILMSTVSVARGVKLPMEYLRFLILIPLPFEMPQLFDIMNIAPWLTHLSYRFYSMMMTTTFLGLILAMVYKPRTWCTICPIATISDVMIKK